MNQPRRGVNPNDARRLDGTSDEYYYRFRTCGHCDGNGGCGGDGGGGVGTRYVWWSVAVFG